MSILPFRPKRNHTPRSWAKPPLCVVKSSQCCPECGTAAPVYTLACPALYDPGERHTFEKFMVITHVTYIPNDILTLLEERCPTWRFDTEGPIEPSYLMNHCRCGAKLDDGCLHGDYGGAFLPQSWREARKIRLLSLPSAGGREKIPLVCEWVLGLGRFLDFGQAEPW